MLDLADLGPNPQAPQFGRYGLCRVRYGKAEGAAAASGGAC